MDAFAASLRAFRRGEPVQKLNPFHNTEDQAGPGVTKTIDALAQTDDTGTFNQITQTNGDLSQSVKWYRPSFTDTAQAALAVDFATKQHGSIITRQCFKRNDAGEFVLDTDEVDFGPGYELLDTSVAGTDDKFELPDLKDVKPI